MKTTSFLPLILAICLLPTTLRAQATPKTHAEPVNYFAEFAELMHAEADTKPAPAPATNRFPAFLHYRTVMNGKAEDFLANYETTMAPSVPPAEEVFANWTDCTAFRPHPVEDCSGR